LCEGCRNKLVGTHAISPEQFVDDVPSTTNAALVGPWGRLHLLHSPITIGRDVESPGLRILDPSISGSHAVLSQQPQGWTVRDLGSQNGTFVNDARVASETVVRDRDMIRFGLIAMYFLEDASSLPRLGPARMSSQTIRPRSESEELRARSELPSVRIRFHEPTGGGGGVVELNGISIQLTLPQLELMRLLVSRWQEDQNRDGKERGLVATSEVMQLSLESSDPRGELARKLVGRLRKALDKAGLGELVETRHGFGYRLRVIPLLQRD